MSLSILFDHETGDSYRDSLVWVTLTELEDIFLKNEIFRSEFLPLDVCSKLLGLGQTILIL